MDLLTRAGELAMAASGFAGLTLPRIGIFTNNFTPSKSSVYAEFTLAAYTGYANVTPTVSAAYVSQPDNLVSVDCSRADFIGPTAGAGTDAYGWFLFDNVTHAVWAAGRFGDAPLSLQNLLDKIGVNVELHLVGSAESEVNT